MPLAVIRHHPHNVRDDLGDLTELAASIAEIGLLQPLVVAPADDLPGTYLTIAGNRRRAGALLAGKTHVPAIIRYGLTEQQVYQAMLIENLHRVGLSPMEEARALKGLKDSGMTLMEIATSIGKSDAFVSDRIVLNTLPLELATKLISKRIQVTEATRLAKLLAGRPPEAIDRGWDMPHFAATHPLHVHARARCRAQQHKLRRRIAGACGACWEHVIREDQQRRPTAAVAEVPVSGWWALDGAETAHTFSPGAVIAHCGMVRQTDGRLSPALSTHRRCQRCEELSGRPALIPRYDPWVRTADQRGELVTRAKDLEELHALAGGVRETVMTATPQRVRLLLDRAFRRLTVSVEAQQRADERARRSFAQAVTDLEAEVAGGDAAEPEPRALTS